MQSCHYVYLLKSVTSSRTYVGYSVDPFHRLRQHNGEITGGAKRTHADRPWQLWMVICGFPDKTSALQFEWRWHRIRKGNKLSINDQLNNMFTNRWTNNSPLPFSFPLYLIYVQHAYSSNFQNIRINWHYFHQHSCWNVYYGYQFIS